MASAMIDRAEFPVQRNRTFKGLAASDLPWAPPSGCLFVQLLGHIRFHPGGAINRPANLGVPAAAIFDEKAEKARVPSRSTE